MQDVIVYTAPGCTGCAYAKKFMALSGYNVEERSIWDGDNRQKMEALGFDMVPVVVLGDRAFPGYPEDILLKNLGLPREEPTVAKSRATAAEVDWILSTLVSITPRISQEFWETRPNPTRNRIFGQLVWHVFSYAELVMDSPVTHEVSLEQMQAVDDRESWQDYEKKFPTFISIVPYGEDVIGRFRIWAGSLTDEILAESVESPWGPITVFAFLADQIRHLGTHLDQILTHLKAVNPAFQHFPEVEDYDRLALLLDIAPPITTGG